MVRNKGYKIHDIGLVT